jgi:preprotein translocase subunit SecA
LIYQRAVKYLGAEPDDTTAEHALRRLPEDVAQKVATGFVEALRVYRDRQMILQAVDGLWIRHLTDLDVLRQGIGLRAYGQRDPLVSFKKEAHEMYQGLLAEIQNTVVHNLFHVPVTRRPADRSERKRRNKGTRGRKRRRRR